VMRKYFTLEDNDGSARIGFLSTPHGVVRTPTFMPVATYGVVKTLMPEEVRDCGAQMLLSNAYHLALRPGIEAIQQYGGLHEFIKWYGPILTDSGGFQGYSLAHLRRVSEEGLMFRSHIDGSTHFLTPEQAIKNQEFLGSDIAMVLDVCASTADDENTQREAMERTTRWAARCLDSWTRNDQLLFGIVQGGTYVDMRQESTRSLVDLDFPGYAIGGLSVGEPKELMYQITGSTTALLPEDKPRYLMGVGSPEDLVECVARGIDLFDCALPTRVARNGALFTRTGRVNIEKTYFRDKLDPVDADCDCFTCVRFSASYLHNLFKNREMLGYRLASIHNLRFILSLMERMREAIHNGTFEDFRKTFINAYRPTDENARLDQHQKRLGARHIVNP
jgi:queuine tRNA-ribosyltransferase